MSKKPQKPAHNQPQPSWKALYRLAWIGALANLSVVLFSIIAFFIWSYSPGTSSTEAIFAQLQMDRFGALMSLDLPMLLGVLVMLLLWPGLFAALRPVNPAYALFALILGVFSVIVIVPGRPIMEMVALSNLHAAADSAAAQAQYLAAGEALLTHFGGTAWAVSLITMGVSSLTFSLLMLRSAAFGKVTAWLGVVVSVTGLFFLIPVVGPLLSLIATFAGLPWMGLLARDLIRLARQERSHE